MSGIRSLVARRKRDFAAPPAPGPLGRIETAIGVTPSGLALLLTAVIGWLIGLRLASRPLLVLAYGLVLLLGIGWILGRRHVAVEVSRSKVPTRAYVGQSVRVQLMLRGLRRQTTIVMEERLPAQLGPPVRFSLASISKDEETLHAYSFTPNRRGRYEVGPLFAEWSDPFGLTRRRVPLDLPAPIIVHPRTEPAHDRVTARAWEDPPVRPPVSKPWPTGFEFYAMRDYVNGDDPRRIVWRATARTLDLETGTGRYLVRESEQGIVDRVNLLIDTDWRSHGVAGPTDTFELAVTAAASLGIRHLRDGFGVTLASNEGQLATGLRGRRAEIPLLDQLATVEREEERFTAALDRLLIGRTGRSHNVVITPHVDREAARRLRLILDSGTTLLLTLVLGDDHDPASIRRAASLGCSVAEIAPGVSIENAFRQAIGGRR